MRTMELNSLYIEFEKMITNFDKMKKVGDSILDGFVDGLADFTKYFSPEKKGLIVSFAVMEIKFKLFIELELKDLKVGNIVLQSKQENDDRDNDKWNEIKRWKYDNTGDINLHTELKEFIGLVIPAIKEGLENVTIKPTA